MAVNLSSKTLAVLLATPTSFDSGLTAEEIADSAGISVSTVYRHLNEYRRLGFIKPCIKLLSDPNRKAVYLDQKAWLAYRPSEPLNGEQAGDTTRLMLENIEEVRSLVETGNAMLTTLISQPHAKPAAEVSPTRHKRRQAAASDSIEVPAEAVKYYLSLTEDSFDIADFKEHMGTHISNLVDTLDDASNAKWRRENPGYKDKMMNNIVLLALLVRGFHE